MALSQHVIDGDVGYGVLGSLQWHYLWLMDLDGQELADYALELGSDKAREAIEWRPDTT